MIAAIVGLIVGIMVYIIYNRVVVARYAIGGNHAKHVLAQVMEESQIAGRPKSEIDETLEILKADINDSPALKFLSYLPFGKQVVVKIVKAGKQESAGMFIVEILAFMVVALGSISYFHLNPWFAVLAVVGPIWLGKAILQSNIRKRNDKFISMFPDVLDMIVRSVRSGFPINSAINMVAENMDDPVKSEFRQVADELALGRPLNEALNRLAARIEEQDVRFFVVVLRIQQETGGNLGEIISNLSGVIRKRKQLRQKIRAITSEGRITGYILSAIPITLFCVLLYLAPDHLTPLFVTHQGNILLGVAIGMVVLAQIIVRRMVKIDI
jgi:tight adherence protein B